MTSCSVEELVEKISLFAHVLYIANFLFRSRFTVFTGLPVISVLILFPPPEQVRSKNTTIRTFSHLTFIRCLSAYTTHVT